MAIRLTDAGPAHNLFWSEQGELAEVPTIEISEDTTSSVGQSIAAEKSQLDPAREEVQLEMF